MVLTWGTERKSLCIYRFITASVVFVNHKTRKATEHVPHISLLTHLLQTLLHFVVFPLKEHFAPTQSQEPSFHPSFHLSSTREQSNSGLPSRTLTSLWIPHSHWERAWRLLVSGWLVFNLQRGNSAFRNCLLFVVKRGNVTAEDLFAFLSLNQRWGKKRS